MTTDHYCRMKTIFQTILDYPQNERRSVLDALCGDDVHLSTAVLALLESDDSAPGFLEKPIVGEQFRLRTRAVAETASRRTH